VLKKSILSLLLASITLTSTITVYPVFWEKKRTTQRKIRDYALKTLKSKYCKKAFIAVATATCLIGMRILLKFLASTKDHTQTPDNPSKDNSTTETIEPEINNPKIVVQEAISLTEQEIIKNDSQEIIFSLEKIEKVKDIAQLRLPKLKNWQLCIIKNRESNQLLHQKRNSKFFEKMYISDWVQEYQKELDNNNVDSDYSVKPKDFIHNILFEDQKKLNEEKYSQKLIKPLIPENPQEKKEYFNALKKEIIEGLAHEYKIHLQIKPEYFISFINDLKRFIVNKELFSNIYMFKFAEKFIPEKHYFDNDGKSPDQAIPTVVLYVNYIPGTIGEKTQILKPIIQALVKRYKNYLKNAHLGIPPRFNRHVTGFVYLAGGAGDDKKVLYRKIKNKEKDIQNLEIPEKNSQNNIQIQELENELKKLKAKKDSIYTPDWAFFKDYEINIQDLFEES